MARICYQCFRSIGDTGSCPFCGYDHTSQASKYPMALRTGTVLAGRYTVGRVLGQGGFGVTYIALDMKSRARVAIKEYLPVELCMREQNTQKLKVYSVDGAENYEYGKKQFLEEARTLAALVGNEHIVNILSYFEENGTAYFAMEYMDGVNLNQYMEQLGRPLQVHEAARILLPIMESLDWVHSKGLVHRDISPDNIMIRRDGTAKLIDFGAARYSTGEVSRSLDVILKHGFAPREQYARHGRQGPYTDVYSMAATYYYAITGKVPPDALDRMESDFLVRPSAVGVNIRRETEDALLKGLEVNPRDRYQTMDEFYRAMLQSMPQPFLPDQESEEKVNFQKGQTETTSHENNGFKEDSRSGDSPTGSHTAEQMRTPDSSAKERKRKNISIPLILLGIVLFYVGSRFGGSLVEMLFGRTSSTAVPESTTVSVTETSTPVSTPEMTPTPTPVSTPETTATPAPVSTPAAAAEETLPEGAQKVSITPENFLNFYDMKLVGARAEKAAGKTVINPEISLSFVLKPEYANFADADRSSVRVKVRGEYVFRGITSVDWKTGEFTVLDKPSAELIVNMQQIVLINGGSDLAHRMSRLLVETAEGADEIPIPLNRLADGAARVVDGMKFPISPLTEEEYRDKGTFLTELQNIQVTEADGSLVLVGYTGAINDASGTDGSIRDPEAEYGEAANLEILPKDDGTAKVTLYARSADTMVIPETLFGYRISEIGDYAFAYHDDLKSVTLPSSVTTIGSEAFSECGNLESLAIPNSVTSIDDSSFSRCTKLTVVVEQGSYAEQYCKEHDLLYVYDDGTAPYRDPTGGEDNYEYSVMADGSAEITAYTGEEKRLILPQQLDGHPVRSIGESAFENSQIISIVLPEGLLTIGEDAFVCCYSLVSVSFPDSLQVIDSGVFNCCTSLESVVIPEGISEIAPYTFYFCTRLSEVVLPDALISIGNDAFNICGSLKSVVIPDSVIDIGDDAFKDTVTLTVGQGSYAEQYCKDHGLSFVVDESSSSAVEDDSAEPKYLSSFEDLKALCASSPDSMSAPMLYTEDMVIEEDLTIPRNRHLQFVGLRIPEGVTLTVSDGAYVLATYLNIDGTLSVSGSLTQDKWWKRSSSERATTKVGENGRIINEGYLSLQTPLPDGVISGNGKTEINPYEDISYSQFRDLTDAISAAAENPEITYRLEIRDAEISLSVDLTIPRNLQIRLMDSQLTVPKGYLLDADGIISLYHSVIHVDGALQNRYFFIVYDTDCRLEIEGFYGGRGTIYTHEVGDYFPMTGVEQDTFVFDKEGESWEPR